jgi:hypothetical protein
VRFRKIEKFSGRFSRPAENEKVSLENQNFSRIFGFPAENPEVQLKI